MISVRLRQPPSVIPTDMATQAARICYSADVPPDDGSAMNVRSQLFNTGHHTTLQHSYYSFIIEGIAVGDVTFGLHLANPFYNSDQRSGRYCTEMFASPDMTGIARYIRSYWPEVSDQRVWQVCDYVMDCIGMFNSLKPTTEKLAKQALKVERPNFPKKLIDDQAVKIAQEQLRVLVPVIMPTALVYTINLSALSAMYQSAFTPVMRVLTSMMADEVIRHDPSLRYMFVRSDSADWSPDLPYSTLAGAISPQCELLELRGADSFVAPTESQRHPVDQLHFHPMFMANGIGAITTRKHVSVMTFGQDQRHRTLRRSAPQFTGYYYVPPLLDLQDVDWFMSIGNQWEDLAHQLPATLGSVIAPYGAMVDYVSEGDFNALIHEQGKRLCWNAQEEIRELARQQRTLVVNMVGKKSNLARIYEPPCFRGKCLEGSRYCGRRRSNPKNESYFDRQTI